MKEWLLLNEVAIWCFFAAVAATGFLCGLMFRSVLEKIWRKNREKTVYLAVQEGTVPMDSLSDDLMAEQ